MERIISDEFLWNIFSREENMDFDISDILKHWPFKPGEVNVRRIIGSDGREKLQLRLDLLHLRVADSYFEG